MCKPNGNVFDEVRNFFIDGKWAYSVYTDGTDDNAVYEQPEGRVKDACRKLSERVYREVLKVTKWEGKPVKPLMVRIDIGVIPDKSTALGCRIFLNEIESEICTWLPRYCSFNVCNVVASAAVEKTVELLQGSLDAGRSVPNSSAVKRSLERLKSRISSTGR